MRPERGGTGRGSGRGGRARERGRGGKGGESLNSKVKSCVRFPEVASEDRKKTQLLQDIYTQHP